MSPAVVITMVSVANLCSLMTAALYPEQESLPQLAQSRQMAGLIAIFLGLVGQSFYLLLLGWTYLHPENRVGHFWFEAGGWCSMLTFIIALFGRRLKRWAGLASGATTFFLWGLAGLGSVLSGH